MTYVVLLQLRYINLTAAGAAWMFDTLNNLGIVHLDGFDGIPGWSLGLECTVMEGFFSHVLFRCVAGFKEIEGFTDLTAEVAGWWSSRGKARCKWIT